MTAQPVSGAVGSWIARMRAGYAGASMLADRLRTPALLLARVVLAYPFWNSGLTKVATVTLFQLGGFRFRLPTPVIGDNAFALFATEFFHGLPRWLTNAFTVASAVGELTLPILLVLGLLTRFAAAGILAMALVIQLFVYPEEWWDVHAWWITVALLLAAQGAGAWSLDRRLRLEAVRAGA
jgi:putative oxidoreductase